MGEDTILEILDGRDSAERGLLSILEDIQAKYSYLSEQALRLVAEKTGRSLVDVYGVATFYKSFSLKPRGKHLISVCLGTACHVSGALAIAEEFRSQLGIGAGETTPDKEFTLETVNCLGACAMGPVVVVDGRYFSKVRPAQALGIIEQAQQGFDEGRIEQDYHVFPVEVSCPRCNHNVMDAGYAVDGYPSIRVTTSFGARHGWLRLSSLYGSHNVCSEHETPVGAVVHFFCSHCHADLTSNKDCTRCDAPMVQMTVRGGGMLQICSRKGCRSHMLDVSGVNF